MPEPAQSLLISACLGALVGLIRQWEAQQASGPAAEFAGLRTFAIVSMLGAVGAYVTRDHAPGTFAVTLAIVGGLVALAQVWRSGEAAGGYTTAGAALLSFFSGALVVWGERQMAVLVAALTMLLLGLKQPIHQWTRSFTAQDVRSTLQFAAITGVILPLVPDRDLGPFKAFNPWSLWLMVVLISGLGFFGYIFVRLLGNRAGITLSGLVGGLASSTATTLAFSKRSREDPGESASYALAIVLACTVMLGRVLVIAMAISPDIGARLWAPLLVMSVPGLLFGLWMWVGRRQKSEPVEGPAMSNPLGLGTAVKFALLYAAVKFLVKAATSMQVTQGLYAVSAIAGLTDVDAITVSMAGAAREGALEPSMAATAVVLGCLSNTVVKAGMGATLGSPGLRRVLALVLGATVVAGGVATWWFR
ncbi:MAG: MgtC/SapB family protein [Verrucomicrobiales bacterium]|nr:MgtC/SapB family protein [Verrucomicrobiales bacterium]